MKLQQVLIILTAAFVMLIIEANADYAQDSCQEFCNKHNPGNDPYALVCNKLDQDDHMTCVICSSKPFCKGGCSPGEGILCGNRVEINRDTNSDHVGVVLGLSGGLFLAGCVSLACGIACFVDKRRVGSGGAAAERRRLVQAIAALDSTNPGAMMMT